MLKIFIFITLLLIPLTVVPGELNKTIISNQVFYHIIKNNPNIDIIEAKKIANYVVKHTSKFHINPKILSAILAQESMYNNKAKNTTNDYSIGQINIVSIKQYKFDRSKMMLDVDYAISCSAKILNDIKLKHGLEHNWWSRYHSKTRNKRIIYEKLVKKYL